MSDDTLAMAARERTPQIAPRPCANCGADAQERFCGSCGQETRGPPTTPEFLREILEYLYADHLVFCLHAQSFLLIVVLLESKAPPLLASRLSRWVFGYFYAAARRVYGGSWPETLIRATTAMALHQSIFVLTGSLLVYMVLAD